MGGDPAVLDFRVETFLAVCQTMSYTQAARRLNITQPAVSQHIAHLERSYGVTLFERRGRHLELTQAGEELRAACETMAHDERVLRERLAARQAGAQRVRLRIGVTLTAGEYLVARPLGRHLARHPELEASVRVGDTRELLDLLGAGEVDCAFVEGVFDARALASDPFVTQRLLCVCAPDHALAGTRQAMARLTQERLVVREPGSGSRAVLELALAQRNLTVAGFADAIEASGVGVCRALVEGGAGISFLYEAAVRDALDAGRLALIEVEGVPIEHDIAFVRLPGSLFEPQLARLLRDLRAWMGRESELA